MVALALILTMSYLAHHPINKVNLIEVGEQALAKDAEVFVNLERIVESTK